MATYVAAPPSVAILCGSSVLMVQAPDELTALVTAKSGETNYLQHQIEGIAQEALWRSGDLEKKVMTMRKPQVLYTLGNGTFVIDTYWQFPLQVYIVDAV